MKCLRLLGAAMIVGSVTLVADAGLTHRYSFNDGAAKDSVGKIDATLKGNAKIADGKLVIDNGDLISSDPKLSYLEFNSSVLPKSGSVSLVVWVTAKTNPLFSRVIDFGETLGGDGNAFIYFVAEHEESQSRAAITSGDTGAKTYLGGPKLTDDKPHMAALVIDGTAKKLRLFIDGKESATVEDLGSNTLDKVNPVHCWIGRSSFDADPGLTASIDEFRVYDHALSADEIAAMFKAGPETLPPSTQPAR